MPKPRTARCGTPSGYSRHQRADEVPCDACARAKSEYDKRWSAAPEKTRKNRLSARAQVKAYGALARENPTRYAELYAHFKAQLTADQEPARD